MSQFAIALCDGDGDSADVRGLGSGDLAIPYFRAHDSSWGYVFGDSFSSLEQADGWMSPCILIESTFDNTGTTAIQFTEALPNGTVAQLFDYAHNANNGLGGTEVTRVPNDCIEIGTRTYIQYTSVNHWPPVFSISEGSLCSGIAYSDDYGKTWTDFPYHWPGDALGRNGNLYGQWTFCGVEGDWLYAMTKAWNGTHQYSEDHGRVQLIRFDVTDFSNGAFNNQQSWAHANGVWQWMSNSAPTPMTFSTNGNNIGEFSVKKIGNTWVMSYFDATDISIKTRTATALEGTWSAEKVQIAGTGKWGMPLQPSLYGGYVHPGSESTSNLCLIVSQWNGIVGARPYTTTQWTGLSV